MTTRATTTEPGHARVRLAVDPWASAVAVAVALVVVAAIVLGSRWLTFPLTFGWIRFEAGPAMASEYTSFVAGFEVGAFDATSLTGWLIFHVLDVAAVLVIVGAGYFGRRRFHDREEAVSFALALLVWRGTPRVR